MVRFGIVRDEHHRLMIVAQRWWRFGPPCWAASELAVRGGISHLVDVVRRMYGLVLGVNLMRLHLNCAGLHAQRQVGAVLVDRLLPMVAMTRLHRYVEFELLFHTRTHTHTD